MDQLRTIRALPIFLDTTLVPAALVANSTFDGEKRGKAYGFEGAANWRFSDRWRVAGSYSFLRVHTDPKSRSVFNDAEERDSPIHQLNVRSFMNLTDRLELDTMLYLVGNLSNQDTHSYARLDLRLGYRLTPDLELSLAFQNLLEHRHKEFANGDDGVLAGEVPRSAYARLTWTY